MGRLIKNQLARLVVLTAGFYQVAGTIEAFIWPKFFWDFLTTNFNGAVAPIPILQIVSLLSALLLLALEWPLPLFAGSAFHRSIEARLALIPLAALVSALLYQTTNSAIYYLVGEALYLAALAADEVVTPKPWQRPPPKRARAPPMAAVDLESGKR